MELGNLSNHTKSTIVVNGLGGVHIHIMTHAHTHIEIRMKVISRNKVKRFVLSAVHYKKMELLSYCKCVMHMCCKAFEKRLAYPVTVIVQYQQKATSYYFIPTT